MGIENNDNTRLSKLGDAGSNLHLLEGFKMPVSATERKESIELTTNLTKSDNQTPTADEFRKVVEKSIGRKDLGTLVPQEADEFGGTKVDKSVKCATTSSQWLLDAGVIDKSEFKLRVQDLSPILPSKGFHEISLKPKLDLSQFPEGPIGFIVGKGMQRDGSNHMAFIERNGRNLSITHNDTKTGQIVKQPLTDIFYDANGIARYDSLQLYVLPRLPSKKA